MRVGLNGLPRSTFLLLKLEYHMIAPDPQSTYCSHYHFRLELHFRQIHFMSCVSCGFRRAIAARILTYARAECTSIATRATLFLRFETWRELEAFLPSAPLLSFVHGINEFWSWKYKLTMWKALRENSPRTKGGLRNVWTTRKHLRYSRMQRFTIWS